MKIFFSLNHFLPEKLAGIEIYTFNLAAGVQAAGINVAVLIPYFDARQNDEYYYEGIRVIRYAEDSASSREMILGNIEPNGLAAYISILQREKPDLVHFQEIAAGRGIGLFHVKAVSALGIKIFLTCHLSTYSCQTGNLVFKGEALCDGIIRTHACTACTYHERGITGLKLAVLQPLSKLLYAVGINGSKHGSTIGTALGFPFIIDRKKNALLLLAQLCDKIVVLTRWYQQMLVSNGVMSDKIIYAPQGLTGKPGMTIHRYASLPLRLVFIGRVSKYKGVHLLLEALRELPEDTVRLAIFGPVTEDEYGKHCMELSKAMSNVQWMGSIASDKIGEMLPDHDILCLPSTFSEMSALVIQEAFAAGLPVLASNVYGNAEQVKDGINGWLFDFKSVASLTQKLAMLIADPALVDAAKLHIPATRSFDEIATQHINLYQESLSMKTMQHDTGA